MFKSNQTTDVTMHNSKAMHQCWYVNII